MITTCGHTRILCPRACGPWKSSTTLDDPTWSGGKMNEDVGLVGCCYWGFWLMLFLLDVVGILKHVAVAVLFVGCVMLVVLSLV